MYSPQYLPQTVHTHVAKDEAYAKKEGRCQHLNVIAGQQWHDPTSCAEATLKAKCTARPDCNNAQRRPDGGHCLLATDVDDSTFYSCGYTSWFKLSRRCDFSKSANAAKMGAVAIRTELPLRS